MERNLSACYCLLALALVISTVSLVLNILVLSKPNILPQNVADTSNGDSESNLHKESSSIKQRTAAPFMGKTYPDDKVYVFAYDVPWEEYQYVTTNGELRGLSIDVVEAVCNRAGRKCHHIVSPIEYCWNSEKQIGTGLLDGWFDSCAVFLKTIGRENVFRFSGNFYQPKAGKFYSKSGVSVDAEKLSTLTVGVRSNWYLSPECLLKHNIRPAKVEKVIDYDELYTMLNNGTIDAVFVEEGTFDNKELISYSTKYDCSLGGSGIMHRVDSDIPLWFVPALETIKRRGIFGELCAKYSTVKDSCMLDEQ